MQTPLHKETDSRKVIKVLCDFALGIVFLLFLFPVSLFRAIESSPTHWFMTLMYLYFGITLLSRRWKTANHSQTD